MSDNLNIQQPQDRKNMPNTQEKLKLNYDRYDFNTTLPSDINHLKIHLDQLLINFNSENYEVSIGISEDYQRYIVAKVSKISDTTVENIIWLLYGMRQIDNPITLERVNKIRENLDRGKVQEF